MALTWAGERRGTPAFLSPYGVLLSFVHVPRLSTDDSHSHVSGQLPMTSREWSRLLHSLYWVLRYCSCCVASTGCGSLPEAELRRMAGRALDAIGSLAVYVLLYTGT